MLFHLNKSTFLASKLKIGFVNHTFSYRGVAIFFNKYGIAIYSKRPSQTTLCQKQSETLLKNRACHDWSGYNGVSLVSGPDTCVNKSRARICRCNRSVFMPRFRYFWESVWHTKGKRFGKLWTKQLNISTRCSLA